MSICLERRSIRNFLDTKISDDIIESILTSAMQAPSAKNQQPWEFIVIKNRDVLDQLSTISNGARHLKKAPLAIITLMKKTEASPQMRPVDMAACTQNILLEATHHNVGSLWIGVYPLKERIENILKIIDVDHHLTPFSIVALGYTKDSIKQTVLRYDKNRVKVIK